MKNFINSFRFTKIKLGFSFLWLGLLFFFLFEGRFNTFNYFLLNLLPLLLYYTISSIFEFVNSKTKKVPNTFYLSILVTSLIAIDQLSKLIISSLLPLNKQIEVFLDWIFIYPTINSKGSMLGSIFSINLGRSIFTLIDFIALIIIFRLISFYKFKYRNNLWINLTLIFIISAICCVLIDNIFWGGSLDFISFNNLFIADLKDFYIDLALGCFIAELIETKNLKNVIKFNYGKNIRFIKDFLKFNIDSIKNSKQLLK